MSSFSPFTDLLSLSNFIQASTKVVIIDGSSSWSGLSLLAKVEASMKIFFASIKASCACSKSNWVSFDGVLRTHVPSSCYFPLSFPIVILLHNNIFTFRSSSHGSNLTIYRFWVGYGGSTPLSHILAISVGQSSISWSNRVKYLHDERVGLVQSQA